MTRRRNVVIAAVAVGILVVWLAWWAHSVHKQPPSVAQAPATTLDASDDAPPDSPGLTTVYAHNLRLRKGPGFQVYIRWLRGKMLPLKAGSVPTLDNVESFIFQIDKGVINVNLGDIGNFLNTNLGGRMPLKNISVNGEGDQLKLTGTLHKLLVPLPVELTATVSSMPDGRIHLHVTKISILKLPLRGLLGGLKLGIKDIIGPSPAQGVEAAEEDFYLNTANMLPPPHIRGRITGVTIARPDVVVIYGNSPNDVAKLAQWHNFLRLTGGAVRFGRLTMQPADLTLIDASDDTWFDLDLMNYRAQLVRGYSRITQDQGLEMYMPDVDQKMPAEALQRVPLDTLKDRNRPLPAAKVTPQLAH